MFVAREAAFAATRLGMLLTEGGPPHFMGAHPCYLPVGRIEGVALERTSEPARPPTTRPRRRTGK